MHSMCLNTQGSSRAVKTTERVGFSSLPDQLVNHELDRGFTLNILCIGLCLMGRVLFSWL